MQLFYHVKNRTGLITSKGTLLPRRWNRNFRKSASSTNEMDKQLKRGHQHDTADVEETVKATREASCVELIAFLGITDETRRRKRRRKLWKKRKRRRVCLAQKSWLLKYNFNMPVELLLGAGQRSCRRGIAAMSYQLQSYKSVANYWYCHCISTYNVILHGR